MNWAIFGQETTAVEAAECDIGKLSDFAASVAAPCGPRPWDVYSGFCGLPESLAAGDGAEKMGWWCDRRTFEQNGVAVPQDRRQFWAEECFAAVDCPICRRYRTFAESSSAALVEAAEDICGQPSKSELPRFSPTLQIRRNETSAVLDLSGFSLGAFGLKELWDGTPVAFCLVSSDHPVILRFRPGAATAEIDFQRETLKISASERRWETPGRKHSSMSEYLSQKIHHFAYFADLARRFVKQERRSCEVLSLEAGSVLPQYGNKPPSSEENMERQHIRKCAHHHIRKLDTRKCGMEDLADRLALRCASLSGIWTEIETAKQEIMEIFNTETKLQKLKTRRQNNE